MWALYQKLGYCINFTVSISSDPDPSPFKHDHMSVRISRCLGFVCNNSQYGVTHRDYVIL